MELDVVIKERKKETIIINDITTQTSIVKMEVVDETCDKSQTEQNQHNNEHENSSMVSLKTEPADDAWCKSSLYADHYIKDELVIGPTVFQNQNGVLENPPESENALNLSQCSETSLKEQPVSLKELPNVEKKESQTCKKRHYNKKSVSADIPSPKPERIKKRKTESRKTLKRMKDNNECGNKHNKASKRKHRVDTTETGKNHKRLYKCDVAGCQKAYNWQANLSSHQQIHTDTTETGKNRRRLYKCDVAGCQKAYYWKANLSGHKQIHSDTGKIRRRVYKCNEPGCQKKYYSNPQLTAHKRTHTGEKPFICEWEGCGSRFALWTEFARHTRKHTGQRPFACAPCQLQFSRSDYLSKHMKSQRHNNMINTGEFRRMSFKCNEPGCQKEYSDIWKLTAHKRTHTVEKPFICEWEGCGSRFKLPAQLARHTRKHTGERPFACAPCQLQFTRSDHLSKHMKSKGHDMKSKYHIMINTTDTGENRRRPYKCNVAGCQKVYYYHMKLTAHKRTHSEQRIRLKKLPNVENKKSQTRKKLTTSPPPSPSTQPEKNTTDTGKNRRRPYKCNVAGCQKEFVKIEYLRTHKRRHTGEKPYICNWEGCGSRFVNSVEFSRHKRKHTGERPFACASCQIQFKRSDHLSTHMKSERHIIRSASKTGEILRTPYKCDVSGCQKEYYNNWQLKLHKRTHSNTTDSKKKCRKLHKCDVAGCQKAYYHSWNLKGHKRTHTDVTDLGEISKRLHKCDVAGCQKAFVQITHLKAHKRRHTGEKPYICNWEGCGSRFRHSAEFSRHKRKHTGERPFACAPCQIQFKQAEHLRRHMKSERHMIMSATKTGEFS